MKHIEYYKDLVKAEEDLAFLDERINDLYDSKKILMMGFSKQLEGVCFKVGSTAYCKVLHLEGVHPECCTMMAERVDLLPGREAIHRSALISVGYDELLENLVEPGEYAITKEKVLEKLTRDPLEGGRMTSAQGSK